MISPYSLVLVLHIASMAVALGGIASQPLVLRAVRRQAPESLSALSRAHLGLENLVIAPAGTLTLLTGAILATVGGLWGELWVSLPLSLLVFVLALHGAYVVPTQRRLERLANGLGDTTRAAEPAAGAGVEGVAHRLEAANYLSSGAILLALALMVLKPS